MDKLVFRHKETGETHTYVGAVFKINSTYPDGSPKDCTLIPNDMKVRIDSGDAFLTAYIKEEMTSKTGSGEKQENLN